MNQAKDTAEAAELQSWLVGNARTLRPLDQPGLMGWALTALRAQSEQLIASNGDAELRQQLATALHERDQLAKAISDAAFKAGIVGQGTGLTGPTLIMLADDLAEICLAPNVSTEGSPS